MNKTNRRFAGVVVLAALTLTGCTNTDYDFNEVDLTMGFGSDSLTVPLSNSKDLPLEDILDLETDGSVRADESTGWDYLFHLAGGEVAAAHPLVEPVVVDATTTSVSYDVSLSTSSAKPRRVASNVSISPKTLVEYTYDGDAKDVVSISRATVDPVTFTMSFDFPEVMRTFVPTVKKVTIAFPDYICIDAVKGASASLSGSTVTLTNVSTSQTLKLSAECSGLDFTNYDTANGSLTLGNDHISIFGRILMGLDFDVDLSQLSSLGSISTFGSINAQLAVSRMTLRSAAGRFDPHIELTSLGEVDVTGVPDFLDGGNVVVDLDNPQIILGIDNDMDIAAYLSGDIVASKDGATTATIHLSNIHIQKNTANRLCICRKKTDALVQTYGAGNVYEVSNLSDLVRVIPDHLKITNVEAKADLTQDASIVFGHTYTVKPSYEVDAPLAFRKDAMIVYRDTLDGWRDDIDDLRLSDDAYVLVTCDVSSRLPVYLTVDVTPIDVNGQPISANKIKVDVPTTVIASSDGVTPAVTSITAKVTQLDENALKELDGMIFTITGAASHGGQSVEGITLNARNHTLRMDNIKATVVGKVIGDFN